MNGNPAEPMAVRTMSQSGRHAERITVLLEARRVVAVANPGSGAPRIIGICRISAIESDDAASVEVYHKAIHEALGGLPAKSISLGLPIWWLTHACIASPPLRGLDRVGFLLREMSRLVSLPQQDTLLAYLSHQGGPGQPPMQHMVVAARESTVLALVARLRDDGIQVVVATCATTAAISRWLAARHDKALAGNNAYASVFLRSDGFAIAIHSAAGIQQVRIVGVEPPEEVGGIAQLLIEEVRRSSIFYREVSRGGTIERLTVLGRFAGDPAQLRALVSTSTGTSTEIDPACGVDGDVMAEARALAEASRVPDTYNLIPVELRRSNRRRHLAAIALLAAVSGLTAARFLARDLRDKTRDTRHSLSAVSAEYPRIAGKRRDYDLLHSRIDRFQAARAELQGIDGSRIDLGAVLNDLARSLDDVVRVVSFHLDNPVGQSAQLTIRGAIHADEWDYDTHLSAFTELLSRELELPVEVVREEAFKVDGAKPFTVRVDWPAQVPAHKS